MKTSLLLLLGFLAYALAQDCSCNSTLQVATFNTLQIPITTTRTERLNGQLAYFSSRAADIDILCLQELWEPSDKNAYIANLSSIYPYHAFGGPEPSTCTADCSSSDVEVILTCGASFSCLGATSGFNFFDCIDDQCEIHNQISTACRNCILNPFESGLSVRSKFRNCAGLRNVYDDVDTSCQFVFDDQTDNLILSKYPIIHNETLYYSISPFTAWSVTYAAINTTNFGVVHAFCTHTVANQPFFDLSQESFNQSSQLISFVRNRTSEDDIIFLMGDFNAGPEGEDLDARFPDTYWNIRNANFTDSQWLYANMTGTPLQCTYCEDNPLTTPVITKDEVIDHIFISNSSSICVQAIEIFAKEEMVKTSDGTSITLSDHYGVRGVYCKANRTIDSIPPPPTAVSTGSSNDNTNNTSGTTTMESQLLLLVFSAIIGVLLNL